RRARWRSDQFLDVGFNIAIVLVVVAVIGGVWMLVHRTGLAAVSGDAADLFGSAFVLLARRVAPSVPLYAGAAALLVSALGIWWWGEGGAALWGAPGRRHERRPRGPARERRRDRGRRHARAAPFGNHRRGRPRAAAPHPPVSTDRFARSRPRLRHL